MEKRTLTLIEGDFIIVEIKTNMLVAFLNAQFLDRQVILQKEYTLIEGPQIIEVNISSSLDSMSLEDEKEHILN